LLKVPGAGEWSRKNGSFLQNREIKKVLSATSEAHRRIGLSFPAADPAAGVPGAGALSAVHRERGEKICSAIPVVLHKLIPPFISFYFSWGVSIVLIRQRVVPSGIRAFLRGLLLRGIYRNGR
jgi:hypothetical protein